MNTDESILTKCLFFTSNRLSNILRKKAEDAFKDLGIGVPYVYMLVVVNQYDGITQSELAEKLDIAPSTCTRFVERLVKEGILRKEFYFCTGAQKPVYKQLTGTPKASFCIENKFSPVMSFNGDVVFEENMEYKERAFQILPMLKKMYQEPTNPFFKVFHINIKKIRTFSYAEGPKEYSLE